MEYGLAFNMKRWYSLSSLSKLFHILSNYRSTKIFDIVVDGNIWG
jgi:hypothetical protein